MIAQALCINQTEDWGGKRVVGDERLELPTSSV